MRTRNLVASVTGAALLSVAPVSRHWLRERGAAVLLESASARAGRPLTPMSVAGLRRRAYYGAYAYPY